ncbi:hypothetical protein ANN_13916 [Periplaneta americana]|uniref:Uncharacterized protein n=1 Tax=Periplaneta americana TaxID=6978 RepID=A0ABQ8SWE4_PERAM|nr:hypothetical protein ANN_13916 [Periplaneta americana]
MDALMLYDAFQTFGKSRAELRNATISFDILAAKCVEEEEAIFKNLLSNSNLSEKYKCIIRIPFVVLDVILIVALIIFHVMVFIVIVVVVLIMVHVVILIVVLLFIAVVRSALVYSS